MENKTGMEAILSRIRDLALDYQAFRHIAKTCREPERWAVLLNDYRESNRSRVYALFDESYEALQSEAVESVLYLSLRDALQNVTS